MKTLRKTKKAVLLQEKYTKFYKAIITKLDEISWSNMTEDEMDAQQKRLDNLYPFIAYRLEKLRKMFEPKRVYTHFDYMQSNNID